MCEYAVYSVLPDISNIQIFPSILEGLALSLDYFAHRIHVPGEEVTHVLSQYYLQLQRIPLKRTKGVVFFREWR
jgi:hypothetical protein